MKFCYHRQTMYLVTGLCFGAYILETTPKPQDFTASIKDESPHLPGRMLTISPMQLGTVMSGSGGGAVTQSISVGTYTLPPLAPNPITEVEFNPMPAVDQNYAAQLRISAVLGPRVAGDVIIPVLPDDET